MSLCLKPPVTMYQLRKTRSKRNEHRLSPSTQKSVDREQAVKEQLVRMSKVVRGKFKELRNIEQNLEVNAKPFVNPIIESIKKSMPLPMVDVKKLKLEVNSPEKDVIVKTDDEKTKPIKREKSISTQTYQTFANDTDMINMYLNKLSNPPQPRLDSTYGVRLDGKGGTLIGDSSITFSNGYATVQDEKFKISQGLLELLFMKVPDRQVIDKESVQAYKEILNMTNAHRQMYSAEKPINATKGVKYTSVISQLFPPKKKTVTGSPSVSGKGVVERKSNVNINVNSIVNRLRLLTLSKAAGHTGHGKEIARIVSLLRLYKVIR